MGWVYRDDDPFDFAVLPSGRIEFRDRAGQYRIIASASAAALVGGEYQYRYERAVARRSEAPAEVSDTDLYVQDAEFRHCCDELLRMHCIDPDWVSVEQVFWLIFPRREGGEVKASPLQILNQPRPQRRPPPPATPGDKSDLISLVAALVTVAGGDLERARALAESPDGAALLETLAEVSWGRASGEERNKREFQQWADKERQKDAAIARAMMAEMGMAA